MECKNNDASFIIDELELEDIPPSISHFVNLTQCTQPFTIIDEQFKDEFMMKYTDDSELLIFTDGSVDGIRGGYGCHGITKTDYTAILAKLKKEQNRNKLLSSLDAEINKTKSKRKIEKLNKRITGIKIKYYQNNLAHDGISTVLDCHAELSNRCSIDFCEAMAIRQSLINVQKQIQRLNLMNIKKIRIITDSMTNIKWIAGQYRIRNMKIKEITFLLHCNGLDLMKHKLETKLLTYVQKMEQTQLNHLRESLMHTINGNIIIGELR